MRINPRTRTRIVRMFVLTDVQTNETRDFDNQKDLCAFLGVHQSTAYQAAREGKIISSGSTGRAYRLTYARYKVVDTFAPEIPEKHRHDIVDLTGEIWKTVPGYYSGNMVSNMGRAKFVDSYGNESLRRITGVTNGNGRIYSAVRLLNPGGEPYRKQYRLSRVIIRAFNDRTFDLDYRKGDKMVVDHIDNNPSNNALSNLRVVSQAKNIRVAYSEQGVVKQMTEQGLNNLKDSMSRAMRKYWDNKKKGI